MKPVKAIDLVWKAQPAMACLKSIAEQDGNLKFAEQVGEWLDQARELLHRKDSKKSSEKATSALDAEVGDMIQYGPKS